MHQFCLVGPAAHQSEQPVITVLDRHIQIVADLRLPPDHIDEVIIDLFRIAVKQTDPSDPLRFAEGFQQQMKNAEKPGIQEKGTQRAERVEQRLSPLLHGCVLRKTALPIILKIRQESFNVL